MVDSIDVKIPSRFLPVFDILYSNRSATAEQILTFMFPEEYPPNYLKSLKNKERPHRLPHLYATLRMMIKQGFVQYETVEYQKRTLKAYFLTKNGNEMAKYLLLIEPDTESDGFVIKYGDFPFELQRPPKGRLTHHLLLVDFFLHLNFIRAKDPSVKLQYRDNRFARERYIVSEKGDNGQYDKNYIFRPDAEFRIFVEQFEQGKQKTVIKNYLVEIDRGTEYLEELKTKFQGYNRYFECLEKEGRHLPEAVVFVTDTREHDIHIKRRWKTISDAFISNMKKWGTRVNLIFAPLNHIEQIINQEVKVNEHLITLLDKIKYYLRDKKDLSLMRVNWGEMIFTLEQQLNGDTVLFLIERSNAYETRGIVRVYEFLKDFESIRKGIDRFANIKIVKPIFFTYDFEYRPVSYELFEDKETASRLMKESYALNVKNDPYWSFGSGKQVDLPNPLQFL